MIVGETRGYWRAKDNSEFAVKKPLSVAEQQHLRWKIKENLANNRLTRTWLVNRLEAEGILTDKTEMTAILTGVRRGAKVDAILVKSVEIIEKYTEKVT